jgi:Family of unknown function (DUF6572)
VRFGRRQSPAQSLFDPEKIDLVTEDPAGGANLYIVQDQPWLDSDAETDSLDQKIAAYVTFACQGQMEEIYPELRGHPWRIVIDTYVGPPPPACWTRLSAVGDAVRDIGGDLIVQELAFPEPPETVPGTVRGRRVGSQWADGEPVEL